MQMLEILSIQAQQEQLSAQRHLKSAQATEQGFHCLTQAENTHYAHPQDLQTACDYFAEAIAQNRLNPEPYLGMALILFLLKDYPMVQSYLQEVRQLAPEHPDLVKLEKAMQTKEALPEPSAEEVDHWNDDELNTRIHLYYHDLATRHQNPSQLILNPQELEHLRQDLSHQKTQILHFQKALQHLDQHHETHALHQLMLPIQQLFQRYEKQWKSSQEALFIQNQLQAFAQKIVTIHEQLESDPNLERRNALETELEAMVDQCDHCADQLDALSGQGYQIGALESLYENLVHEIESCFEWIDGIHETERQRV